MTSITKQSTPTALFYRLITNKPLLLTGFLLLSVLVTGHSVLRTWQLPFIELFATSGLAVSDLAKQMTIIPTMLVAIMAGGLLAVASLLLQQLVKNPLASDTTLAVGSGAQLALLLVTLFVPNYGLFGSFWVAFIGALSAVAIVFVMALPSKMNPMILVLSGLIINILTTAISALCLIFFSEKALGVMVWGGGYLIQMSWQSSKILAMTTIVTGCLLVPLLKPLTLLSLGDDQAKALGVSVGWVRSAVVILVATITALVVSEVGILSFIGLGAATLVNVLAIRHFANRLLVGFCIGGLLLLTTSNLAVLLMNSLPIILPAGAVTGILGAPLIIWIILQQKRQSLEEVVTNFQIKRRSFSPLIWVAWLVGIVLLMQLVLGVTQTIDGWQVNFNQALITQFRLPRTLSALATGAMLACAGVLIQTLTRNPMASPEVLGISSGAAVGVLLSVILLSVLGIPISLGSMMLSGSIGALLVLMLLLWLARSISSGYLLLVGIALTALMNGILNVIQLSGDPRLQAILNWLSGTTYSAKPESVWWIIAVALVFCCLSYLLIQPLRPLGLGTTVAKNLGVNVRVVQTLTMVVVAVLSAASTLAVGPLSFIGLMTPHLAMALGAVQLKHQLPLAMLLGTMLMMLSDWIGRYTIFPYEIPAGTIASVIGGAYFVYLMRKIR